MIILKELRKIKYEDYLAIVIKDKDTIRFYLYQKAKLINEGIVNAKALTIAVIRTFHNILRMLKQDPYLRAPYMKRLESL